MSLGDVLTTICRNLAPSLLCGCPSAYAMGGKPMTFPPSEVSVDCRGAPDAVICSGAMCMECMYSMYQYISYSVLTATGDGSERILIRRGSKSSGRGIRSLLNDIISA